MSVPLHRCAFLALAAGAVLAAGAALAQQPAPPAAGTTPPAATTPPAGYRMGPGMMGGYGPGYGPGYGQGYGPGPGYGPGYGYRMGPGMMGGDGRGYGMGPGMMGGFGPGFGMMGGYGMMGAGLGPALWALDLDDAQRKQVLAIQEDLRKKQWELAGKSQEEMAKLRDAWWTSGKRDRAAILAGSRRLSELRQQGLEQSLDAADRLDKVLTEQQREQLRRWGPWWMHGDGE